ncbi:hypothetical protein [Massilia cavernae]|uniref:Class I SAM-dependent methyltransferase n=1 Tax=Massilia cavernae TaxID=2320864 RepID=A0A418XQ17_9BURK|nr:hypothetical protein [Massilia cavernae]RJG14554.1 hypothetical protein D3872_17405 [Massilia cavernae]
MQKSNVEPSSAFNDPIALSDYAEKTRRLVPGWSDLQKMTALLVAERAQEQASVLVVGAGGVELAALAETSPQWHFVGVDQAAQVVTRFLRDRRILARTKAFRASAIGLA